MLGVGVGVLVMDRSAMYSSPFREGVFRVDLGLLISFPSMDVSRSGLETEGGEGVRLTCEVSVRFWVS